LLQLRLFFERFNATCSASKACVLNLPQSLNAELDGSGVKVQAVLPGVRRTDIRERSGIDVSQIPGKSKHVEDENEAIQSLRYKPVATDAPVATTSVALFCAWILPGLNRILARRGGLQKPKALQVVSFFNRINRLFAASLMPEGERRSGEASGIRM
jgi:hypothetical protein